MKPLAGDMLQVGIVVEEVFALAPVEGSGVTLHIDSLRQPVYLAVIFHIQGDRSVLIEKKQHDDESPNDNQREMRPATDPEIRFF